jgi:DnaJ-class molecular chaperone
MTEPITEEVPKAKDFYDILGIPKDATKDEIKNAYRRRATEVHPDKQPNNDNTEFLAVSKAYRILSDIKSRLFYDKTGNCRADDTELNLKVKAIREIQVMLINILDTADDEIFFGNLPEHVLLVINANIAQASANIAAAKKRMSRLRRFKKRFKYKSKDRTQQDFIEIGITAQIHNAKGGIFGELDKIQLFKKMLELLGDYEYEPEVKAAMFSMAR